MFPISAFAHLPVWAYVGLPREVNFIEAPTINIFIYEIFWGEGVFVNFTV